MPMSRDIWQEHGGVTLFFFFLPGKAFMSNIYFLTLFSELDQSRNCFLITLNISLHLLLQSFSVEIVRQITTVIVKYCVQLHLVNSVIYSSPVKSI